MISRLQALLESRRFEIAIIIVIVINAITLGLETSSTVMQRSGPFLHWLDRVVLGIFTLEVLARLVVYRMSFWRDP